MTDDSKRTIWHAVARLLGFQDNLANYSRIPKSYISLYHELIDEIETVIGKGELEQYRVPDAQIKERTKVRARYRGTDEYGLSKGTAFDQVPIGAYYCERPMFFIQLQGLITFLDTEMADEVRPVEKARATIGFVTT